MPGKKRSRDAVEEEEEEAALEASFESGDEDEEDFEDGEDEGEEEGGEEGEEEDAEDEEEDGEDGEGTKRRRTDGASAARRLTAFVGNLPYTATREDVLLFFKSCEPSEFRLLTRRTGQSKGAGFMEFSGDAGLQKALKLHHATFVTAGDDAEGRKSAWIARCLGRNVLFRRVVFSCVSRACTCVFPRRCVCS
jgi:RNA recognition motif-containing protein